VSARAEVRATLRLAVPVVVTHLGYMAMTTVDTILVGRLGAEPLSTVALGNGLAITPLLIAIGVLMGLDPVVAQAFGAGRWAECGRAMRHGVLLAALLSVPTMLVLAQARGLFSLFGQDPALSDRAAEFVRVLNWSTFPFIAYAALRQYLQGVGIVKPGMWIVLGANVLNFLANWALVFGNWGAPALGAVGSAWATTVSRWLMFLGLAAYVFGQQSQQRYGVRSRRGPVDWRLIGRLVHYGAPVGMQYGMEVGVFSAALMLMGWLGTVPLAGHQIAINLCSITFMVPLGFSATAAVRVGQALGRDDVAGARRAALAAYACGLLFMSCSALAFALAPEPLARIYTAEESVVRMAAQLLLVGAAFQLFDGGQTIGIGALRGAADTRVPMVVTIVAYWGLALPLGYLVAFVLHGGPTGLWWGLTLGLATVALALGWRFHRRVRTERLALLKVS
jgi:MATE family multidrug resistance protein